MLKIGDRVFVVVKKDGEELDFEELVLVSHDDETVCCMRMNKDGVGVLIFLDCKRIFEKFDDALDFISKINEEVNSLIHNERIYSSSILQK